MGMAEDMQQDAIDCATQALEKYNIEKDIAAFIKKEFDKKYNPTWHAVGPQLRFVCDARDEALHILLPRPSRDPSLQVRLNRRRDRCIGALTGERVRVPFCACSSMGSPWGSPRRDVGHSCRSLCQAAERAEGMTRVQPGSISRMRK